MPWTAWLFVGMLVATPIAIKLLADWSDRIYARKRECGPSDTTEA